LGGGKRGRILDSDAAFLQAWRCACIDLSSHPHTHLAPSVSPKKKILIGVLNEHTLWGSLRKLKILHVYLPMPWISLKVILHAHIPPTATLRYFIIFFITL
jgi:hypothetical protein